MNAPHLPKLGDRRGDLGEGMCDDHIHERDIVSYRPLGSAPDLPKEVLDNNRGT